MKIIYIILAQLVLFVHSVLQWYDILLNTVYVSWAFMQKGITGITPRILY